MPKEQQYFTLAALKTRKWTDGAIKKFLGNPDKNTINPYYRAGPPIKLYLIERVESVESSKEFIDWLESSKIKREKLSKKSKETAARRRKELLEYIEGLEIEIPVFETKELYKLAIDHYNDLWESRGNVDKFVDKNTSDKSFLNRIAVNMLRHEYSEYEEELGEIFGKVGVNEGYCILKNKVLDKISEVYPFLENACKNQKCGVYSIQES